MTVMPGEDGVQASRFSDQGSVTLDGSGNGEVRIQATLTKRQVTSSTVKCTLLAGQPHPVTEAQCNVYIGTVSDLNRIDGTYSGSTGDTSDTMYYLEQGQAVIYRWTGGDAGTIATVKVLGWESVSGRGFRAFH